MKPYHEKGRKFLSVKISVVVYVGEELILEYVGYAIKLVVIVNSYKNVFAILVLFKLEKNVFAVLIVLKREKSIISDSLYLFFGDYFKATFFAFFVRKSYYVSVFWCVFVSNFPSPCYYFSLLILFYTKTTNMSIAFVLF